MSESGFIAPTHVTPNDAPQLVFDHQLRLRPGSELAAMLDGVLLSEVERLRAGHTVQSDCPVAAGTLLHFNPRPASRKGG